MSFRLIYPCIALSIWAASLYAAYNFGASTTTQKIEAAKIPVVAKVIEAHNEKADAGHQVEVAGAKRTAKTESNFQRIQRGVTDYAEKHAADTDCGLDDDGLRLWRAANSNTDPGTDDTSAGGDDAGLRGVTPAGQRPGEGSAGKPYGGGTSVPPGMRSPFRPGQVAGEDEVSDFADDASRTEEELRQRSLDAHTQRAGLRDKTADDSAFDCRVCEYPIPQRRREAVPGVDTCIECQEHLERALVRNMKGL